MNCKLERVILSSVKCLYDKKMQVGLYNSVRKESRCID